MKTVSEEKPQDGVLVTGYNKNKTFLGYYRYYSRTDSWYRCDNVGRPYQKHKAKLVPTYYENI